MSSTPPDSQVNRFNTFLAPQISVKSTNVTSSSRTSVCAFDWDVYKNRKTALQYLKRNRTLVDMIIETEDGSAHEFVHSQVMSAFGDKLNEYIERNGRYIESYNLMHADQSLIRARTVACWSKWPGKIKLIRLCKLNKYTLDILVECAYSGYIRTDIPSGGIWQVLSVADHYEMVEVIRACCAFLMKNLDRSNCIFFYHIGIRHKHPLQRCAWHKIRSSFKYILAENLQNSDFRARGQHSEEIEQRNNLATIKYEHFEPLLMHDKLNINDEESIWQAIQLWCNYDLAERASRVSTLLPCMRFPRFKSGTEFSTRQIWRDPLILNNKQAQYQLAILDRNQREFISYTASRDGFSIPCAACPRQLRPRIPYSILLAIGGWQQGRPTTLIESYDVNCNLWFETKKRIMYPLAYHGIESIGGMLYICGGTDGSDILSELFTFDPIRGDCAQKPSMRENRCYVSTAHLNGFMYAMGGHNGHQRMKSVERFDLVNEIWLQVPDMNVARSDASACVYNSLIYIAGGLNDQVIESSVEFYSQKDNTWTFTTPMMIPRTSFTLLLFNNTLLAIGGNDGTERLSSVEQFDFALKVWSHHSNMRNRRSTFSAALVDENKLIVVGGYNGQTPFNQVEMFDEQSHAWIQLHKIRFDRSGLKVVVVDDLPNASEYTFLGSAESTSYSSFEDNNNNNTRLSSNSTSQSLSLTTRARRRILRSVGRQTESPHEDIERQS